MNSAFKANGGGSNTTSGASSGGGSGGGGKVPAPHTGPHSPAHLKPQPLHSGGSGQGRRPSHLSGSNSGPTGLVPVEGTSLTVTINPSEDNFRPTSSSSNRNARPTSSSGLGNTVAVLSQQVNQLAISVARIEMRLNGGFNAYGAPREFSNSNRIGSAPVPGQMQSNGYGMSGVGVAGGLGGMNAAYCLSCDSPVNNMNKTGAAATAILQSSGGQVGGQPMNNNAGGSGFHFAGNAPNQAPNNGPSNMSGSGYLSLPTVPDAVNSGQGNNNNGQGVAMTGFGLAASRNNKHGTSPANSYGNAGMPPPGSGGNTKNNMQQGQGAMNSQSTNKALVSNTTLPVIERGTYFAPAREVSTEMMGVKGADGRLYRSDVPKVGGASNNRTKSQPKSKPRARENTDDTPQLEH
jgi:hypothetical protein